MNLSVTGTGVQTDTITTVETVKNETDSSLKSNFLYQCVGLATAAPLQETSCRS